jgi:hypothetical protein
MKTISGSPADSSLSNHATISQTQTDATVPLILMMERIQFSGCSVQKMETVQFSGCSVQKKEQGSVLRLLSLDDGEGSILKLLSHIFGGLV